MTKFQETVPFQEVGRKLRDSTVFRYLHVSFHIPHSSPVPDMRSLSDFLRSGAIF